MKQPINITILASGNGSNAENLVKYFAKDSIIKINLILSNKKNAYVLERELENHTETILETLKSHQTDFIVLAGFLLKIPEKLIKEFPKRIINIHPSLLPKFGGKGMYGERVHKAVIQEKEAHSGITIHLVNEDYDKGKILLQAHCDVGIDDNHETLAKNIHQLEHKFFPEVINDYVKDFND